MQYALSNGQPIQASKDAQTGMQFVPTCPYCGMWVDLGTAPWLNGFFWTHHRGGDAVACQREREQAQAELYQAIGVEL